MTTCTCTCSCPASLDQGGLPDHTVSYPGPGADWDSIPLGIDGTGGEVYWDLADAPHLLLAGPPGSGKTVLARLALFHVLSHPDRWEVAAVDPKLIELGWLNGHQAVQSVDVTPEAISLRMGSLIDMVEARHAQVAAGETLDKALLVVVDEAAALDVVARDRLTAVATLGAAVKVHLLVATQDPAALPGRLRSNMTARIAYKRTDVATSELLFGHTKAAGLTETHGRAYRAFGAVEGPFHGYYAPQEWAETHLA